MEALQSGNKKPLRILETWVESKEWFNFIEPKGSISGLLNNMVTDILCFSINRGFTYILYTWVGFFLLVFVNYTWKINQATLLKMSLHRFAQCSNIQIKIFLQIYKAYKRFYNINYRLKYWVCKLSKTILNVENLCQD